jgi:hypothetical protein
VPRRNEIAAASVVLAIVLLAIGAYKGDNDTGYFLIASLIVLVTAAVLYSVVLPRIGRPGMGALVIAILAVVSIVVFWLGFPTVLAGAAAVLALAARRDGSEPGKASAALALAAVAVIAHIVVTIIG